MFFTEGTAVHVVNADTGEKVGTITGDWKRVHGVALVPELNKGFITDGDAGDRNRVRPEDAQSTPKRSRREEDADWILYEPVTKRIFVFQRQPEDQHGHRSR